MSCDDKPVREPAFRGRSGSTLAQFRFRNADGTVTSDTNWYTEDEIMDNGQEKIEVVSDTGPSMMRVTEDRLRLLLAENERLQKMIAEVGIDLRPEGENMNGGYVNGESKIESATITTPGVASGSVTTAKITGCHIGDPSFGYDASGATITTTEGAIAISGNGAEPEHKALERELYHAALRYLTNEFQGITSREPEKIVAAAAIVERWNR